LFEYCVDVIFRSYNVLVWILMYSFLYPIKDTNLAIGSKPGNSG